MTDSEPGRSPLLDLILGVPNMAERLLATHTDDGSGHCRACPLGGQAGRHRWPCSIFDYAVRAREIARERDVAERGDR